MEDLMIIQEHNVPNRFKNIATTQKTQREFFSFHNILVTIKLDIHNHVV